MLQTAVRDAIVDLDPDAAVSLEPMTSALSFAFLPSRIGAVLVGALGLLGAALAMIGLYGVVSFAVTRRTPEIGIRMALGSPRRAVASIVLRDGAVLVIAGIAIGLSVALVITRPLAAFLVAQLPTTDPWSFLGTTALLALTSALATWSPAGHEDRTRADPPLRVEGIP